MSASSNAGRVGVWGASGSGKSSYVKKRLGKTAKRVVIFDPLDEYGAEGYHTIRGNLDAVRVYMGKNWGSFRIAYVPPAGQEAGALSKLSRLLMAAQAPFKAGKSGLGVTLVVEEMNLCFPTTGGAERCKGFADICSRGRHFGIHVIGLSQRIAEVATRFRGNCTETVVFRQKGPRDVKAAAAELGVSETEVRGLVNLSYLHEQGGAVSSGSIVHRARKKV